MKKLASALLILCFVLLSACGVPGQQSATAPETVSEYSLTAEGGTAETGADEDVFTLPVLEDYLEACEAAAYVEVIEVERMASHTLRYICRVEEDYFGNLNYMGMEPGCISVYTGPHHFDVGDRAHIFLHSSENIYYPHILYTLLKAGRGRSNGYAVTKDTSEGLVSVWPNSEITSGNGIYGLSEEESLDEAIRRYAEENPRSGLRNVLPEIHSYEDMIEHSTEIWLIRMGWAGTIPDDIKYIQHFNCQILEVLRSEKGVQIDDYSGELMPITKELEPGAIYLYFQGMIEKGDLSALSEEFCLLKKGDEDFDRILALLRESE